MTACIEKGVNCDNLWRPWYIIIVSCLQIYLLYSGVARYITFKSHYFDPKYGGNWNPEPLNFCLAMLIIAAFFVGFFLYFSLTRSSNLASEGISLGQELALYTSQAGSFPWPPQHAQSQQEGSNAGLYATANGVLDRGNLNAGLGAGAEEEGMPPFDTWSARSAAHVPSSDFAGYPVLPTMFRSMISTGGTTVTGEREGWASLASMWRRFQRHFIPTSTLMHILSAYAFSLSLPVLDAQQIYHQVLPYERVWKSNLNSLLPVSPPNAMSVEFFNLLLAFAALAHRYPSVFWRTNHCFAFTFSLLLVILGIQGLFEINATEIIVKLCWNDKNLAPSLAGLCRSVSSETAENLENVDFLEPVDFDEPVVDPYDLRNAVALFLSTFGTLLMLLLTVCVFDYGIDQFVDRVRALRQSVALRPNSQNAVPTDTASIQGGGIGGVCGLKSEGHRIRRRAIVCRRVIAVVGALCVLAIKMPILIACGKAFETGRQPLLLANIVANIFFFCVWFITWFAFCLKSEWKFKITYSPLYHASVIPRAANLNPQYLACATTLPRLEGNNVNGGTTGTLLASAFGNGIPGAAVVGAGNGADGVGNGGIGLRLISGSPPLYACLNNGGSTVPNVNPGLRRLALVVPPPPSPPAVQGSIVQTNRACSSTQQNVDCCSVDTEGSSRQSGTNNYVCLQSSLNTTNPLGLNGLPQTQSYSNTNQTTTSSINQQPLRPANQENTDSLGALRCALRPSEIISPPSLRFINSSPFAAQGSGEADAGRFLDDNIQESHGFLPQSPSANNVTIKISGTLGAGAKLEDPKQIQPRVTFKEFSEKTRSSNNASEHCSSSNPNSSSDSGIDNHGLISVSASTTPATRSASLFSTLPTLSRTGLSLSFSGTANSRPSEPTYCNQEQMSSSNSTPRAFECPSMPPLNLPQNEAGEVSFASLSRRFDLRATSFEPPSPLQPASNEPATEERLMSRSVSIRRDERPSTGRLCSQV